MSNNEIIGSHFELALLWEKEISIQLISSRTGFSKRTVQSVIKGYLINSDETVSYSRTKQSYVATDLFKPKYVKLGSFSYLKFLRTSNLNDVLLSPALSGSLRVDDFVSNNFNSQSCEETTRTIIRNMVTGNELSFIGGVNTTGELGSMVVYDIALTVLGYVLRGYNIASKSYGCLFLNEIEKAKETGISCSLSHSELDKDWNELIAVGVPYPIRKPLIELLEI